MGEFIALDAAAAIDRAIEIFGCASGYRAEEIPWDAESLAHLRWPGGNVPELASAETRARPPVSLPPPSGSLSGGAALCSE